MVLSQAMNIIEMYDVVPNIFGGRLDRLTPKAIVCAFYLQFPLGV